MLCPLWGQDRDASCSSLPQTNSYLHFRSLSRLTLPQRRFLQKTSLAPLNSDLGASSPDTPSAAAITNPQCHCLHTCLAILHSPVGVRDHGCLILFTVVSSTLNAVRGIRHLRAQYMYLLNKYKDNFLLDYKYLEDRNPRLLYNSVSTPKHDVRAHRIFIEF